ncbi:IclR family transcriptional regulator [Agrobacterium sp. NPDC090273]|uniref:IclR family transcriptional regulator n=1 Tax=Agrobacterium sp. NPDC090273 TaxID=3363919 RepID=UPI00383A1786
MSIEKAGTGTLDMALKVVDYLAGQSQPVALAQIAKAFSASKATIYRHLVTLERHGFVRQDKETSRYEPGVKLLVLGEAVRNRFDVATAARQEVSLLGERTGQAVTICRMIDERLVVLDLIHGRTVIEFGTRPGTELSVHATAHGKVWLAYGDEELFGRITSDALKAWTPQTIVDPTALRTEMELVRRRGFAIAPDELITAVNALAAPIFDHSNAIVGSVAIVGATQFIPAVPKPEQIEEVVATARRISERIGWRSNQ